MKNKKEMNIQTTVMSAPLFFAKAAVVAIACSKYGSKATLVLEMVYKGLCQQRSDQL